MSDMMPGQPGDTNPTQLYPVTEAAELLLHRTGLVHRYTPVDAKRALRAAAEDGEISGRRIDGRMAFAYGELLTERTVAAFHGRLAREQQPGDTNPTARERLFRLATRTDMVAEEGAAKLLTDLHAEARETALREAIEAARGEYLTDATGTDEDTAYNRGVTDAITAICELIEGAQR